MAKRIGTVCIILGIVCLLSAVGFVLYNRWESAYAAQATQSLLGTVQQAMGSDTPNPTAPTEAPTEVSPETPTQMATVQVEGYDCIGILSVPVLELELPVLTDWSYPKLKKAPCLYYGSYYEKDFVISAHNYDSHFGRLPQLQPGDLITFTTVTGMTCYYEVVLLETLPKDATEAMITSGFDLSLYTCTPGGGSRVTVRCNRATFYTP